MQGKLITIFGGGGFLGRYVAQALLAKGARLRVAHGMKLHRPTKSTDGSGS